VRIGPSLAASLDSRFRGNDESGGIQRGKALSLRELGASSTSCMCHCEERSDEAILEVWGIDRSA
jgi:hypothetical protein